MTIKECIDLVDNVKPNQYSIEDKVEWLSFIDGIIINDVLKTHAGYDGGYDCFEGYSPDKLSTQLIVPSPYDVLYTAYLKMKIDEENGETARYNNSATLFNSYMLEYKKYWNKTHMPLHHNHDNHHHHHHENKLQVTEAQYEALRRDVLRELQEDLSENISHDKVYDTVMEYVANNREALIAKTAEGVEDKMYKALDEAKEAGIFDGKDGVDGKDGMSPTVNLVKTNGAVTISVIDKEGVKLATVLDGNDGYTPQKNVDYFDGKDGKDGLDGYTPQKDVDYFDGEDGYTPQKGVDYFDGVDGKDGASIFYSNIITGEANCSVPYANFNFDIKVGDLFINHKGALFKVTSVSDGKVYLTYLASVGGGENGINVTAEPGQMLVVREVDKYGTPTAWKTEDRTHWEEVQEEFEFSTDVSFKYNVATINGLGTNDIIKDRTYTITWNGTEYECTAVVVNGSVMLGNLNLMGLGDNTREPFCMEVLTADMVTIYKNNANTETIALKAHLPEAVVVHKIDSKFLPESFTNGIKSAVLNADYTLTLNFDNGTSYTTPSIRGKVGESGKDGKSITHEWIGDELKLTSASGTTYTYLKGKDGEDGNGIALLQYNEFDGSLEIFMDNGNLVKTEDLRGKDGVDGTSVAVANVSESTADGGSNVVIFSDGKKVTIKNGSKGSKGEDGYTPVKGVDYFDGKNGTSVTHNWNGTTLSITSASGTSAANLKGEKGDDGYTPVKGTDYFTEADKAEIVGKVAAEMPATNWLAKEGEPGYILNNPLREVDGLREIMPTTTIAPNGYFMDNTNIFDKFIDGEIYRVEYNGTVEDVKIRYEIGEYNGTEMPEFSLIWGINTNAVTFWENGEISVWIQDMIDETEITIAVYALKSMKIDPKYLPEITAGVGKDVVGQTFTVDDEDVVAAEGAEIFNDYAENIATGEYSHAQNSGTIASGDYSHAEGQETIASGTRSHAEGHKTVAEGSRSHAEGYGTIAEASNQHVQGKYNIADTSSAHIVGNGSSSKRSNAHTLDWQGNAWYAGTIKVGGTSYKDAEEVALKSDLANLSGGSEPYDVNIYYDMANNETTCAKGFGEIIQALIMGQYVRFMLNCSLETLTPGMGAIFTQTSPTILTMDGQPGALFVTFTGDTGTLFGGSVEISHFTVTISSDNNITIFTDFQMPSME